MPPVVFGFVPLVAGFAAVVFGLAEVLAGFGCVLGLFEALGGEIVAVPPCALMKTGAVNNNAMIERII